MPAKKRGSTLAAASDQGVVLIWDRVEAGSPPSRTLPGTGAPAWAAAYSSDGRLLACAHQDGVVILRDARTHEVLTRLEGGSELARSLAFSPDDRYLACGCYGKPGLVWDLVTLRQILDSLGLDWRD